MTLADLLKLRLITPLGETVDLSDGAAYVVAESDGFGMPPFHRLRERAAWQHGETDLGFRLDRRLLKFRLNARADTPAGHYSRREGLLSLFAPQDEPFILQVALPDGSLREIACYLEKGLSFGTSLRQGLVQGAEIVLSAPDPTFYDPAEKTLVWNIEPAAGLVFPVAYPVVYGAGGLSGAALLAYAGTWLAYPIIWITGPLENPQVSNLSTGEKLRLEYSLQAGEQVCIDTSFGAKTITGSGGSNLMSRLSPDSDLATFHLDPRLPGGVNELVVTGANALPGETEVRLTWRDRYVGI